MTETTAPKTRLDHVKTVANFTVKYSVSYTFGNIVGNNTNASNARNRAQVMIATAVLANMLSDVTEPYVNAKIDKIAAEIEKFRAELKKATEDQE